jgi:thiamine biosynthesis protein ThiS
MDVTLNEEPLTTDEGTDVRTLLASLSIPLESTAVEVNGRILDVEELDRRLEDGDEIFVVRFVGGG